MIRAIQPFDLLKLRFSGIRKLPNEARPRRGIRRKPLSIPDLLPITYWIGLDRQRQTWVQTKGLRVEGLASAKSRMGGPIWEIDYLLLSPHLARGQMDLLNGLTLGAGRCGVDKLFLRLCSSCSLLEPARAAGFRFYAKEYLYRFDKGGDGRKVKARDPGIVLQPASKTHEMGLFQLYNGVYPLHVREAEGLTLDEWREARDQVWRGHGAKQLLLMEGGSVSGWVGISSSKKDGYFHLLLRPQTTVQPGPMLDAAETSLKRQSNLWCLVSEFQEPLLNVLEERGYKMVEEYTKGVRNVTAKVRRPSLVPIGAK